MSAVAAAIPELLAGAGGENRVSSPVSVVYIALSMLAEITGGESREQILSLLGCEDMETARERANALWNANYMDDGRTTCLPAASLWLNEDVEFSEPATEVLAENYYASSYRGQMGSSGFDRALREWINANTGRRLKTDTAGLGFDGNTVMALVTTLFYRAKWSREFDKGKTSPDVFHAPSGDITADFMRDTRNGEYYWGDKFAATKLHAEDSVGNMWIILPDEGVSPEELIADGTAAALLASSGSVSDCRTMEIKEPLNNPHIASGIYKTPRKVKRLGAKSPPLGVVFAVLLFDFLKLGTLLP